MVLGEPAAAPVAAVAGGLALVAAIVTAALTPVVARVARRAGAIDVPRGRHQHRDAVPRLGGLAIAAGTLVSAGGAWLAGIPDLVPLGGAGWSIGALAAASTLILLLGVADDVRSLRPRTKLAGQLGAALLAVAAGYAVRRMTVPVSGSTIDLGLIGLVLALLWIVGVTNAVNLIDGLDGLASGVALIASLTLVVISFLEDRPGAAVLGACLAGALLGFLPFNWPPARVFLGDSGSLLIGFWLSLLSLQGMQKTSTVVLLAASVFALGVPLLDTALAVARRLVSAGPAGVFRADREHLHHRLLRSGRSPRGVLLVLYGACVAGGLLAFAVVGVRGPLNALVVAVAACVTWVAARWLARR
jgi:UDP-GlcNAc:undecaprenyl-phosphate GlcNAc-1-phosphate transferase